MQRAAKPSTPERRSFLERECVGRQVSDRQRERRFDIALPEFQRLIGGRENQIDRHVSNLLGDLLDHRFCPVARVSAFQRLQFSVIKGLHAKTEAIDAAIADHRQPFIGDILGVRLDSPLHVGCKVESLCHAVEQSLELFI